MITDFEQKNSSLLSATAWNIVDTALFIDLDRKIHQRNVSCVMGMRCEHSGEYSMKKGQGNLIKIASP